MLFLLNDGFVTRSMIPWGWVPSHSRPAEDLHKAVEQVTEIWAELGESPKHMLLSLIGVWNTQKRELLTAHRTDNEDDFEGSAVARTLGQERLFFTSTPLHCAHTMLPFSLQCRFAEALRMEKAIRLMERLPRIIPLAARVGGIYWTTDEQREEREDRKDVAHAHQRVAGAEQVEGQHLSVNGEKILKY